MEAEVFISYTQADREAAERLCSSLEANGVSCWFAPRNVAPGSEWAAEIMQAIRNAKALVLILSSNSKSSRQLAREVENADQKGLKIITFRIEDVTPPDELGYYLGNIQWIDAFGNKFDGAVQKLADVVHAPTAENKAILSARTVKPAAPPAWRKPSVVGLAALAILLAVGAGIYVSHPKPAPAPAPPQPVPAPDNGPKPTAKAKRLLEKARTEWHDGNKTDAMTDISSAISSSPNWAAPYLDKAQWEVLLGDQTAALRDFDACIDRKPDTEILIDAYRDRAKLKKALGDLKGAQADQDAARQLQTQSH